MNIANDRREGINLTTYLLLWPIDILAFAVRFISLIRPPQAITACMDYRIVAVILPILLALSWASYNIARAALGQLQLALRDFKKNTGN